MPHFIVEYETESGTHNKVVSGHSKYNAKKSFHRQMDNVEDYTINSIKEYKPNEEKSE